MTAILNWIKRNDSSRYLANVKGGEERNFVADRDVDEKGRGRCG